MAITDKEKGVWGLDEVYNKINQGGIWNYSGVASLFAWGRNNNGTFGNNSVATVSSPVQVPGTLWTSTMPMSASYYSMFVTVAEST